MNPYANEWAPTNRKYNNDDEYEHFILNPDFDRREVERQIRNEFTPLKDQCECAKCIGEITTDINKLKLSVDAICANIISIKQTIEEIKGELPKKRTYAEMAKPQQCFYESVDHNNDNKNKNMRRFKLMNGRWIEVM